MARIASIGAAYPPNRYTQRQLTEALKVLWRDAPVDPAVIDRIHRNTMVGSRHMALPLEEYRPGATWGAVNRKWIRIADELGTAATSAALKAAGVAPASVEGIVFVTVTGLSTPSIDARIANRLGFPRDVERVPIFGLGCMAGAAGLARCADLMAAHPGGALVLLSVELCSLTLQMDDHSVANIIATGLFGDGAAAVVLVDDGRPARGPEVVASRSVLYPDTERVMGWEISESGFRLVLSPEIPVLIREHLRRDVDSFLAAQGLTRADVGEWMIHTGGPKIFAAIEEALELPSSALQATRDVLDRIGNVSSASVLLVLEEVMERRAPRAGSYGLMLALGPGFCSEMVLVRW